MRLATKGEKTLPNFGLQSSLALYSARRPSDNSGVFLRYLAPLDSSSHGWDARPPFPFEAKAAGTPPVISLIYSQGCVCRRRIRAAPQSTRGQRRTISENSHSAWKPSSGVGTEIGHPLVPSATCIRNDVGVGANTRVLLVGGSNMSSKSTLLRSVGINVVLAMAGAPVRARTLRLTPLCLGASIRINDSLQEGSSRFYAEITRLRKIFDLAGGQPALMFLLDELLQGTNSKDRRIGAEGVVRALVEPGAIGLISTHDLALTEIGGLPKGHLHNVRFQDEFENGTMQFDYRLREGVVTKSNGLELMRSIGLDV